MRFLQGLIRWCNTGNTCLNYDVEIGALRGSCMHEPLLPAGQCREGAQEQGDRYLAQRVSLMQPSSHVSHVSTRRG